MNGFSNSVNPFMHSHVVLLGEINVTTVAVEWCFSSVDPFMQSQVVTMVANEWFLSSVNTIMHSQVVLLDEFLITVVAVKWFFTSVKPFQCAGLSSNDRTE